MSLLRWPINQLGDQDPDFDIHKIIPVHRFWIDPATVYKGNSIEFVPHICVYIVVYIVFLALKK